MNDELERTKLRLAGKICEVGGMVDASGEEFVGVSIRCSVEVARACANLLATGVEIVPLHRCHAWIVTRETSARYLGVYEWVRNPAKAAHFVTREAAEAAAEIARENNGGVRVEAYER